MVRWSSDYGTSEGQDTRPWDSTTEQGLFLTSQNPTDLSGLRQDRVDDSCRVERGSRDTSSRNSFPLGSHLPDRRDTPADGKESVSRTDTQS